jgi:preprotein translocase subunit SecD
VAKKSPHPGRTIVLFFLGLAIIFGLVALGGTWKPGLGLDLQGGTRITLTTKDNNVDPASLQEAADIIDQRVNGSGVTEAEVSTQANKYVVVEIPGPSRADLIDVVARQAQLRFRLVAQMAAGTSTGTTTPTSTSQPGSGVIAPTQSPSSSASTNPSSSPSATPKNRPLPGFAASTQKPSTSASPSGSASPSASTSPSASPSAQPTTPSREDQINDPLTWQTSPDAQSLAAFAKFSCPADGTAPLVKDNPNVPLITCDDKGEKFLLSKAIIEGTSLNDANAGIPDKQLDWAVNLSLDGTGAKELATVSRALVNTSKTFAITLDGQVISYAGFTGVINDGNAQITGGFTQDEAHSLATSLKFGSLPIAFQPDPTNEEIGPSLAGNQLRAGITAGIFGLGLVMLYCLIYYRGLGLVVIASLLVAGASTYGLVLLLSKSAGFTLTLPGIAGLIVAVGITADSFIVFFERIRDEMRDGKSMRVAVESGWVRARNTCLAADAVSLLAAVVLYFFAAGVVKGFAFALGLSTLVDLVVFFWFTKPMVSWLGHFVFFNQGHKLSGLDAENLGIDRLPGVRVGGKA